MTWHRSINIIHLDSSPQISNFFFAPQNRRKIYVFLDVSDHLEDLKNKWNKDFYPLWVRASQSPVRIFSWYVAGLIELYSLSSAECIVLVLVCWLCPGLVVVTFNPCSSDWEGGRVARQKYDLQLQHLFYITLLCTLYTSLYASKIKLFTFYNDYRQHFTS